MQLAAGLARLGTESAFELLARAKELEAQGRDIINLGIGQPDFRTPDHIVEAAQKALADGHHGYTPGNGILPLREAVAKDIFKNRGVQVDPGHVVIVPGGKVTMWYAILLFGEAGVEIMYPNPGFPIYESVININFLNYCFINKIFTKATIFFYYFYQMFFFKVFFNFNLASSLPIELNHYGNYLRTY